MYFGLLGDSPIRYRGLEGQFFPYVVRDVYGSKVLPENLGSVAPRQWHSYKSRLPRISYARLARTSSSGTASLRSISTRFSSSTT